ncbi:hypothetical protein [Cohnella silvisoli]|uniref:Peptidase MA-like domain-containing protein n=1 Tax=Cohnella silvisoli TaxID=2873699 RepID=A0ABV1KNU8_9BACL|nr:hypothetical protein [Cohnella silvisoli]MCD9020378.1 hypothetical protein [Cohnella silvisoli]
MNKEGLSYHGKTDVRSKYADEKVIKDINHYTLNMGSGKQINIYVTDDYDQKYGKEFAYGELGEMLSAIEEKRGFKPYDLPHSSLDIYFYTNESNTPLPPDRQANTGAWILNCGTGMPNEIIMNASRLHRDHRQTLVHELSHYFDNQSYFTMSKNTYLNYGGEDFYFWLSEGAAEYCSCFYYSYPANTKNKLATFDIKDRASIFQYAIQQAGGRAKVIEGTSLRSFADIVKASKGNYGVILALYWYIAVQYGLEQLHLYTKYIAEHYTSSGLISMEDREDTTRKFFNKTESQILEEWLVYFNYFKSE